MRLPETNPVRHWLLPALMRFPLPFIITLSWSLAANLALFSGSEMQEKVWDELLAVAVAGVSFGISALLVCEAKGVAYLPRQAISGIISALAMFMVWQAQVPEALEMAMVLTPFLFAFSAPYLGARGGEERFWLFSFRVVSLAAVSAVAFIALCGGLSLFIIALRILFGLGEEVASRLNQHLWLTGASLLWPSLMLMGVPRSFDNVPRISQDAFLFIVHRRLNDFIIAPLALVYAAILHLYAVMILFTLQVPEGQIGWLTLCYGLLLICFRLAADVLKGRAALHTEWLLCNWAWLLIFPLVLLFIAVWLRVEAYGITISRYYLALFAGFMAISVIFFLGVRRSWLIIYLPSLAAIMLFMGSVGPWGAAEMTIGSQSARLITKLVRLGFLENGVISTPVPELESADRGDLYSMIDALRDANGLDALAPIFSRSADDPFAQDYADKYLYRALMVRLGLFGSTALVNAPAAEHQPHFFHADESYELDLKRFSLVLRNLELRSNPSESPAATSVTRGGWSIRLEGLTLSLEGQDERLVVDLSNIRSKAETAIIEGEKPSRPAPLIFEQDGLALVILEVFLKVSEGAYYIERLRADIYLPAAP